MVWINLKNGSGQVLKNILLKDPNTNKTYRVISNKRVGINRYQMQLENTQDKSLFVVMNHELRNKWEIVDDWHTPEEISKMFGTKLDPDANLPRSQRESFWKMKSKPGTINYKQKKKLMKDQWYQEKFSQYFSTTCTE